MNELIQFLSASAFQQLAASNTLNYAQYISLTALLIRYCIPFDTEYTPGDRRKSPTLTITVYINPNVTVDLSFSNLNLTDT